MYPFAKLSNEMMKEQIVPVVAENLCLHLCMILIKSCVEGPLFLVKVSSYNNIFAFTTMDASSVENARIDEKLANA